MRLRSSRKAEFAPSSSLTTTLSTCFSTIPSLDISLSSGRNIYIKLRVLTRFGSLAAVIELSSSCYIKSPALGSLLSITIRYISSSSFSFLTFSKGLLTQFMDKMSVLTTFYV
jgi:hypothetical protein